MKKYYIEINESEVNEPVEEYLKKIKGVVQVIPSLDSDNLSAEDWIISGPTATDKQVKSMIDEALSSGSMPIEEARQLTHSRIKSWQKKN
jgi:hypothetical protein